MKVKAILQNDTQDEVSQLEERVQYHKHAYAGGHETLFLSEIQKGILEKRISIRFGELGRRARKCLLL